MTDTLVWLVLGLPAFIISGTLHEYMHAWSAKKLGDYTATMEGRLSLNPLVHIDPWGLLLMIFARFGWMKPVPINEYNLTNRVRDVALIAAAGPLTNIVLAILGMSFLAILTKIVSGSAEIGLSALAGFENPFLFYTGLFLYIFSFVNIALTIFNLLPLPPLDGFRIFRAIMPNNLRFYWDKLENYSFIIILFLFLPFSPLSSFLGFIMGTGISTVLLSFDRFFSLILG